MKIIVAGATAMALWAVSSSALPQQKNITCWNEGGKRVCGDAMPASAANNASKTYNAQGMVTSSQDRVLTPAEKAAAAAAQAVRDQENDARARESREQMALAESYPSEQDLNRAYQLRMDVSKGSLVAANASLNTQRKALISVLRQAAETELDGKPVAKAQADAVMSQRNALVSTLNSVNRMQSEQAKIAHDYAAAVLRYRKAKLVPLDGAVIPLQH